MLYTASPRTPILFQRKPAAEWVSFCAGFDVGSMLSTPTALHHAPSLSFGIGLTPSAGPLQAGEIRQYMMVMVAKVDFLKPERLNQVTCLDLP